MSDEVVSTGDEMQLERIHLLCRASARMRADADTRWLVVADWLDTCVGILKGRSVLGLKIAATHGAENVACAYLASDRTLQWEYVVTVDTDPRDTIAYRGLSRTEALATLHGTKPANGWGASLTRRLVSESEIVAVNR